MLMNNVTWFTQGEAPSEPSQPTDESLFVGTDKWTKGPNPAENQERLYRSVLKRIDSMPLESGMGWALTEHGPEYNRMADCWLYKIRAWKYKLPDD